GAAAAGLGAGLLATGTLWRYPGVMVLGGGLLMLAAMAALSMLRRVPVRVRRQIWPLEVTRFEPCEASLGIRRSGRLLPVAIAVADYVGGVPLPVPVPPLPRGGMAEVRSPIPTDRRGVLTIGPLDGRRRALAGLAENRAALGTTVEVRVLPRVLPVHGVP